MIADIGTVTITLEDLTLRQKLFDRIVDEAGELTPEETARLAGELLSLAGVSLNTFEVYWKALEEQDREELAYRVEDAAQNDNE